MEAGFARCWSATAEAPHLVHTSESFEKGAFLKTFLRLLDWCPLLCVDSQVVDLVFAMEDMERGLQEMAQSVEHMQEMLKRSPMVQALAQRKPEVRALSGFFPHGETLSASRTRPTERGEHAGSSNLCLCECPVSTVFVRAS